MLINKPKLYKNNLIRNQFSNKFYLVSLIKIFHYFINLWLIVYLINIFIESDKEDLNNIKINLL